MSSAVKRIENPEVPGYECLLPPPPPPPIISGSSGKISLKSQQTQDTISTKIVFGAANLGGIGNDVPIESAGNPVGSLRVQSPSVLFPMQAPYFMPSTPVPPPQPTGIDQPWWVPTDSDTAPEVVSANRPWIEQTTTITNPNEPGASNIATPIIKAKAKFFKRKSECIDPAQDAERVASAQRELSALMKPLKCDLCNAIMNSNLQAKLHYEGKPHQKKVSQFLNQSVKKIKPDDGQVTSTTCSADWNTYCDVCKTWFTSQIDASQHYAGKKHIRATTGVRRQRTKKSPVQPPTDPTGRFGIGMTFAPEPQVAILETPELIVAPPSISPVAPSPTTYPPSGWPFPVFRCDLCGVTANRLEQLETHKRGAKHLKILKMSGLFNSETVEINEIATQASTIDYSIYRTPSGHYYCAPCNRSFQTENAFAQHVEGKKHKTQVNPKPAAAAAAASPLAASNKKRKTKINNPKQATAPPNAAIQKLTKTSK